MSPFGVCLPSFPDWQGPQIIFLKKKHSHTPQTLIGECDWEACPHHHLPSHVSLRFVSACSCVCLLSPHTLRGAESFHIPLQRVPLTEKISSLKRKIEVCEFLSFLNSWHIFIPTCKSQISFFLLFCNKVWKGVLQNRSCYKYRKILLIKLAIYLL